MTSLSPAPNRREFLSVGVAVLGGGFLAWAGGGCAPGEAGSPPVSADFDMVLTIHSDGTATIRVPVPEIGQGVRTSLAMLIAEELGLPWDRVAVADASFGTDMGPRPLAAGSWSVRSHWLPFRQLGAAVREAICATAGLRLDLPAEECRLDGDRVRARRGGRSVPLADVLLEAVAAVPSNREAVRLVPQTAFRLLGHSQPGVDVNAIIHGTREYGIDVARPGMRYAVLRRPPVYGAVVRSIDEAAARAIPGVLDIGVVEPIGEPDRPYAVGGVAVIAENTWAAMRGRDALEVEWDVGPNVTMATDELRERGTALLDGAGQEFSARQPDVRPGEREVRADYSLPLLLHVPLEPPCCTVHVRADSCELWAPTQVPEATRTALAGRLGMEPQAVQLHLTAIGGGFGRRLKQDFVFEAVEVGRRVDGPVQVLWTREDDIKHGFYRPFSLHRVSGTLTAEGRLATWRHHQVGTSRYADRPTEHPGRSEFHPPTWPWSFIRGHRLTYTVLDSPLDRGPLRAPGHNSIAFVVESFLDELAGAAGRDPLGFRRDLLAGQSDRQHDEENRFDPARMLAVLEVAVEAAGGLAADAPGTGRGLAAWFTFGSYCAHVVEASVDRASGKVEVPRVWSAIDCGFAVNPDGVRAQVEGGVIDGLSAALYGEVRIVAGAVTQSNFHDYPVLRHDMAPRIAVTIIPRADAPTGAGEPPYPPLFPALANAVFAASGARIRDLPMTPERVRSALAAANQKQAQV